MDELKNGDLVYWKPKDERFKTAKGEPMAIVGVFLGIDKDSGDKIVADCISWSGDIYDEVIYTKEELKIPPQGLKYKYWSNRKLKKNKDRLITGDYNPPKEEGEIE